MAYATTTDLYKHAMPAIALSGISVGDQQAELDTQSVVANGYMSARLVLPLTSWGADLTSVVCWLAAYSLLTTRGLSPDGAGYEVLRDRKDMAIRWLEGVRDGKITPPDIIPTSVLEDAGGPFVSSDEPRGW